MNIVKKGYQNVKVNQGYLQSHNRGLEGWFYMILGSAFVATRICTMIEDSIHWPLFLKSFFSVFGFIILLRFVVLQNKR